MRNLILLFLFISVTFALDDALLDTKDGPKSSHDLVKEAKANPTADEHLLGTANDAPIGTIDGPLPSPDVVPTDAVKVVGVPSETHAGRPIVMDKPNIVPTTIPDKTGVPSENVAPANSKAEKLALASHAPGDVSTAVPLLASESAEKRVRRDASKSSEEEKEGETKFTTKIPVESVAVAKKKVGEDKAEIATATKVDTVEIKGDPAEKNLPTISPPKSEEKKEDSVKLAKVPTEEIAVAHKKAGEDAEVVTATKSAIVAVDSKRVKRAVYEVEEDFNDDGEADSLRRPRSPDSGSHSVEVVEVPVGGGPLSPVGGITSNINGAGIAPGIPNAADDPMPFSEDEDRLRRSAESSESVEEGGSDAFTTKVPTEVIAVAHKKPGEDAEVVTATKSSIVAVSGDPEEKDLPTISPERVRRAPDSSSSESHEVEVHHPRPLINPGLPTLNAGSIPPAGLGSGLRLARDASKSSESDEAEGDAFTTKVPTETIAVAKKESGKDTIEVGSATKVESVAVKGSPAEKDLPTISPDTRARRDASKSSEEKEAGGETKFTTKIPVESVAVAKKKVGEDKAEIATATKVDTVEIKGDPAEKNLPTISPPKSEEKKEDTVKLAKVPTEEIAVAHKKAGEDTKVVTATKSAIVAVDSKRARRHSEPNSGSHEAGEEESAPSPSSPVINKDEIQEAAVAQQKAGESEPEVAAVATIPIHHEGERVRREGEKHRPGPNSDGLAAGDPVKLEAKPTSRARRFA